MPAHTANLFLLQDVEDSGRTRQLADSGLNALRTVAERSGALLDTCAEPAGFGRVVDATPRFTCVRSTNQTRCRVEPRFPSRHVASLRDRTRFPVVSSLHRERRCRA
jgi:hypothetical protein